MEVKGNKREKVDFQKELYVGLTNVRVVAINPTRAEIDSMLGRQEGEKGEEFKYVDEKDGNRRVRMAFWLKDVETGRLFVHSLYLTNKPRVSNAGDKGQIINCTCDTTYVPFDKKGNIDEKLIPDWWLQFTDKDRNVTGKKTWKVAIDGEESLGIFMRAWLGDLNWFDKSAKVFIDTEKLFNEDYRGLRELIGSGYDTTFTILTGVYTNPDDPTKKYQEIFKGAYLPEYIMDSLREDRPFSASLQKKWETFVKKTQGQYGFSCFHKLRILSKYDVKEDPVGSNSGKPIATTSNEY